MPLANDAFPSSVAFDAINNALTSDKTEQKEAIANAGSIFGFVLKNGSGATDSWHIDLKNKGVVAKGEAPADGKADVTLTLADKDFGDLVNGKADAQRLFMAGKLKIKGNMMRAMKLQSVLSKAQTKAKL